MQGSPQPDEVFPSANAGDTITGTSQSSLVESAVVGSAVAADDKSNGSGALGETELDSALQLLVERAQYITGATGTALALPQGEEMVCRASAGASAPAIGARLQVRSGLTGESIARRQLLRCDNAETDARVNLETCRALGIASIVVLPLLRRSGEVRGLFELFSDHPYAFEERDLIALERMADLTLTALDLAEQRQDAVPAPRPRRDPERPVESPAATAMTMTAPTSEQPTPEPPATAIPLEPEIAAAAQPTAPPAEPPGVSSPQVSSPQVSAPEVPAPEPVSVPEAMLRVQKCAGCGFPVSEGRTLCLDCETKDSEKKDFEKKDLERKQREKEEREVQQGEAEPDAPSESAVPTPEEFVPAFLANSPPVSESWLANHVNLLAIVVLILGILVAVVVFR